MVPIINQYQGTVDEIIGDAIFVLFGVPLWLENNAKQAVACAVAMQLAVDAVNEQNRQEDLPEVEMGIGIHTGPVVVGNVGSPQRMKYGVVGSHVNLTSRIQSYTIGGQILISDTARREVGPSLKIGKQMQVKAKGIEYPVTLYEVLGIARPYHLFLPETTDALVPLTEEVPLTYEIVEANYLTWRKLPRHIDQAVGQKGGSTSGETSSPIDRSQNAAGRRRRKRCSWRSVCEGRRCGSWK